MIWYGLIWYIMGHNTQTQWLSGVQDKSTKTSRHLTPSDSWRDQNMWPSNISIFLGWITLVHHFPLVFLCFSYGFIWWHHLFVVFITGRPINPHLVSLGNCLQHCPWAFGELLWMEGNPSPWMVETRWNPRNNGMFTTYQLVQDF